MRNILLVDGLSIHRVARTLIICALLVGSVSAGAADSLTISQVMEAALRNSHAVRALTSQTEAATARVQESRTAFFPTASADLVYANIGPAQNLEITFGPQTLRMGPSNSLDAHLGASIVVFDFGKRALAVQGSRLSEAATRDRIAGVTNGIAFQAVSLAVTLAMIQQGIAVQEATIVSLDRHLGIITKRRDGGTATDYDALKTQSQIAQAQTVLLDLTDSRAKTRIGLATLIGQSVDSLSPVRVAFDTTRRAINVDSLLSVAESLRPEIVAARNTVAAQKLQQEQAGKEMAPTLGASVVAGAKNGYPGTVDAMRFNWTAAAQVHVPLYDGSRMRYRRIETSAAARAAEEALAEVVDKARSEVLSAISDVSTCYEKLANSAIQVNITAQSRLLAERKLDAGTITNDDVLDTQRDYSQAQLMRLQDEARYTLSLLALNQSTGSPPAP